MDCLQDWPEPVVRVQSISESGAQSIPERYVKPPSERQSDKSVCGDGGGAGIPVIDLSMLGGRHSRLGRLLLPPLPPLTLMSHEKWPSLPPSLSRATTDEYGRELTRLCGRVMRILSEGLGLEEGRLGAAIGGEEVGVCMRVNFYSKCPQPELTLGLSSHSDPGGITVLLVDDRIKGLQVRKDGAWVTVQPSPMPSSSTSAIRFR
uniref:Isopenicillin N synthase-like Fe(2+) 2OG dioxygenase domain-containing protein n=1 Tax=Ananas comosus var. bracteatus TaxID=296719 RepID=A0A6V7QG83_ANACO|nr:unnamed protein product [Ananas comosus var. bracteatus]